MRKISLILCTLLFLPFLLEAQQRVKIGKEFHKNWRIGGIGGVSYLALELKKNFQQATMDMNSRPNAAYTLFLSKRFTSHFEAGLEYEKSYFSGFKNYTSSVNWLVYDPIFNNEKSHFVAAPISYKTNISSFYVNMNYCFLNAYSKRYNLLNINLYLKGGAGISIIGGEMGYNDPLDYEKANLISPLYEKGQGRQPMRDSYGTVHLGMGLNYYFSPRLSLAVEAMFLFVSADYLDGVHNFDVNKLPDGEVVMTRIGVYDTVGQLKMGLSYYFNLYNIDDRNQIKPWGRKDENFENEFYHEKKYNKIKKKKLTFYPVHSTKKSKKRR
jgi:hypothetical protein